MIKTVKIEIDEKELIEGLGPLDLVSVFMNQVVNIADRDLLLLSELVSSEEYQRFIKAARDFAKRLNNV